MKELCLTDLEAAQAGDREAAGRLLEENSGLIWSVARRYFGRGAEAEDLYRWAAWASSRPSRALTPPSAPVFPPMRCLRSPGRSAASSGTTAW